LHGQLVGSLLYLTYTCPDISFVVGLVAWYMQTTHEIHWKAAKMILLYIRGIIQFGIHYNSRGASLLVGFIDFDWVGEPDDQMFIVGYFFSLGSGHVA
jgi:hypothetical protein